MGEFITRDEFSKEIRTLKDEIRATVKEGHSALARAIEGLARGIRETETGWRDRTGAISDKINSFALIQAVHDKQIEALEDNPRLEGIKEGIDKGFSGVNARLDKVNGRLNSQGEAIAAADERMDGHHERMDGHQDQIDKLVVKIDTIASSGVLTTVTLTKGQKVAAGTAAGIGLSAVLHSLFEMLKEIGPSIFEFFKHAPKP